MLILTLSVLFFTGVVCVFAGMVFTLCSGGDMYELPNRKLDTIGINLLLPGMFVGCVSGIILDVMKHAPG